MVTPEELAEAEALCEKATPGPWVYGCHPDNCDECEDCFMDTDPGQCPNGIKKDWCPVAMILDGIVVPGIYAPPYNYMDGNEVNANGLLLAKSRELVPALLAHIDAQAAEILLLREENERIKSRSKDVNRKFERFMVATGDIFKMRNAREDRQQKEIERLQAENDRLIKMFQENTYIESAHMEPGYYDINLRGQGAMLLIGSLIQMFRDTGGENFLTNTLQMTLPDGKTRELFELTIQKVDGKDSPAQKLQRQQDQIQRLKDALLRERTKWIQACENEGRSGSDVVSDPLEFETEARRQLAADPSLEGIDWDV